MFNAYKKKTGRIRLALSYGNNKRIEGIACNRIKTFFFFTHKNAALYFTGMTANKSEVGGVIPGIMGSIVSCRMAPRLVIDDATSRSPIVSEITIGLVNMSGTRDSIDNQGNLPLWLRNMMSRGGQHSYCGSVPRFVTDKKDVGVNEPVSRVRHSLRYNSTRCEEYICI